MIWDKDKVDYEECWIDVFSVSIMAAGVGDNQRWMLTGVYGPSSGDRIESFIGALQDIQMRRDLPWCIGRDFNEVLYLEERNRVVRRTRGMDIFSEFVESNNLINLPIVGAQFTWSNLQEWPSLSKLDRFMIFLEWEDYFSLNCVHALPRLGSDHIPILLKGGDTLFRLGLFPFKFQNM